MYIGWAGLGGQGKHRHHAIKLDALEDRQVDPVNEG
jgi:hypothetical protein